MTTAAPTRSEEKAAATKPKKKSFLKSKKGIIAIVAVLAVGGYGGYTFMTPPAKAGTPVAGDIVPMDATTLNLQGGHYLKLAVAVQLVQGKATVEDFKTSKAAELVIDEFSDRTIASVSSAADRKKLVTELENKMKAAYEGEVFGIYLTQFVTQ